MSGIGKRLKDARERAKLSQNDLAVRVGLTQQGIQAIETGRARSSLKVNEIAKVLGVTPEFLLGVEGMHEEGRRYKTQPLAVASDAVVEIGGEEYARLPVYDIRFAAGAGSANYDETPVGYHIIAMNELRVFTDAPLAMIYGFQVIGDSMEKTILDRAWCFADMRINNLRNPGIYCFENEGEGLIKRAQQNIEDKSVTLISDNPLYPPQVIKKPERLRVIGRVFMSIHRH